MPHWWEAPHPADESKPGINLFYIERVLNDVREAKRIHDFVFVLPHWGLEYTYFPTNRERIYANLIIDAGADGIIGSHTHQIQPSIFRKGKPICFSLGNFLFPDFYIQPTRPIWYPVENDVVDDIDITYDYPEYTDKFLKRVWKHKNRIGLIAKITINERSKSIKLYHIYTYLNSNNQIVKYRHHLCLSVILFIIGASLKLPIYQFLYRAKNKLCRMFNIE